MSDHQNHSALWMVVLVSLMGLVLVPQPSTHAQTVDETAKQEGLAERILPADEPEIRRLRPHWYINRAFDAYTDALAENKPTFLFFTAQQCGFCLTQMEQFRCPAIVRYAGFMKFGLAWRHEDDGGDRLAAALNVQRYPTTLILKTDMDRLHVIGRIEGVFTAKDIDGVIQEAFRDFVEAEGTRMPDLLSVAETREMLDQSGIERPSEAFCTGE